MDYLIFKEDSWIPKLIHLPFVFSSISVRLTHLTPRGGLEHHGAAARLGRAARSMDCPKEKMAAKKWLWKHFATGKSMKIFEIERSIFDILEPLLIHLGTKLVQGDS